MKRKNKVEYWLIDYNLVFIVQGRTWLYETEFIFQFN